MQNCNSLDPSSLVGQATLMTPESEHIVQATRIVVLLECADAVFFFFVVETVTRKYPLSQSSALKKVTVLH